MVNEIRTLATATLRDLIAFGVFLVLLASSEAEDLQATDEKNVKRAVTLADLLLNALRDRSGEPR